MELLYVEHRGKLFQSTIEKDEKTSDASMGVNEVTSSGDQNNDSNSGDDIDSGNSENGGNTLSSEQNESSKTSSLPICKQCNFVFISQAALKKHEVLYLYRYT